ncbi:MAG: hypothetical protein D6788_00270 [Planctomycetota bacterium]|nr:MAG: hypothetical protein D6788_00270 [Planctomycetota bacterium]
MLLSLAMGVPVLATHLVAPRGGDLMRVCAPTQAELRENLRHLLPRCAEESAEARLRRRTLARERFDWSVVGRDHAALYESLVAEPVA